MCGDQPVGVLHPRHKIRPRVRRGAGGNDHIRRDDSFDLCVKLVFQRHVLGRVFLDQHNVLQGVLQTLVG